MPNWFTSTFRRKAAQPPKKARTFTLPLTFFSSRRGAQQVLAAYRENGWLRAVVDTVANGVANPTWRAYKRVGTDGKTIRDYSLQDADLGQRTKTIKALTKRHELIEVPDHEILRILNRPNEEFTGRACLKLMQQHLDLVGEAFLWLQRDASGRVVGYIPLPPHCVRTIPSASRPVYDISYNGLVASLPKTDVIHLRQLDPENPHGRGAGVGLALGDELDTSEFLSRTLKSTFARGGIPAAVVSIDSKSDSVDAEEAITDLQKRYTEGFSGPDNQGKVFFAPGGVTMATLSPNFQGLQVAELDRALRDFVRQTFNVSPELLGDLSASNRSTSEEAKYTLAEFAVLPRLEFLRTELQHRLVPLVDPDVILVYDDPRPASFERTFACMTTAGTEAFTLNEMRELAGLEPDPALEGMRFLPLPGAGAGPGKSPDAAMDLGKPSDKAAQPHPRPLFQSITKSR